MSASPRHALEGRVCCAASAVASKESRDVTQIISVHDECTIFLAPLSSHISPLLQGLAMRRVVLLAVLLVAIAAVLVGLPMRRELNVPQSRSPVLLRANEH